MTKPDFNTLTTHFADANAAREMLENIRWPNGAVCPHCGSIEAYKLTAKPGSKNPVREGVYKCKACAKQFTVTVGTIFEDSHIPLNKWFYAIYMMCSSKKGVSAHQLHRTLGITYKSAWFMCHRIRYAMTEAPLANLLGGIVEVDETYVDVETALQSLYDLAGESLEAVGDIPNFIAEVRGENEDDE